MRADSGNAGRGRRCEAEGRDRVNHRAAPLLRADGQLPADGFQPLSHAGQPESGPAHCLVRVKAGARVFDSQVDGVDVSVQRNVSVS